MEKLTKYKNKRNFKETNEPIGKKTTIKNKLIFVVQHHIASRDHYDFRLQWDGVLLSWAVPKGPSFNPKDKRLAAHVEDHPYDYKDFEGTIPRGQYGGGTVMLWDEGYYEPNNDFEIGLQKGLLKFTLYGKRLKGQWTLVKMNIKEEHWLLIKEKDQYAKNTSGISRFTTSIRSGKKMSEITNSNQVNPFDKINVQLASLKNQLPQDDDWVSELKYDGYRIVAYVENNKVRLLTRNQHDYHQYFSEIADELIDWSNGRAAVFDGEMVVVNEKGKTDFQALQNYMKEPKKKGLKYIIFDLLALDGEDLRQLPLLKRKEKLKKIMETAPKSLHYSNHSTKNQDNNFKQICEMGLEGLVYKRSSSPYSGTRNDDWIKIKCDNRQEFVIGGYLLSEVKNNSIRCLLVGYYEGDKLNYAGRVGTGFSEKVSAELIDKLNPLIRTTTPFINYNKRVVKQIFVTPKLIAEVKFAEWTKDNLLRQASFKGLRIDKKTRAVIKEKNNNDIALSNEDKLLFKNPNITKKEVYNYYKLVAPLMLPYVKERLLSLINCPNGIASPCFFKKHLTSVNGLSKKEIVGKNKEKKVYFYLENELGIINQIQMNTIEFHTWASAVNKLDNPDIMVFDLDPDPSISLQQVQTGALDLQNILKKLNLTAFLKTSGGKGYHIVVPFNSSSSWEKFKEFANKVAKLMETTWPNRYTSNIRKDKRQGKVFIDWLRNSKGATSVAPYSLRARKGAKISCPIKWSELDSVAPDQIDIEAMSIRIKKTDPWKDFFKIKAQQTLD